MLVEVVHRLGIELDLIGETLAMPPERFWYLPGDVAGGLIFSKSSEFFVGGRSSPSQAFWPSRATRILGEELGVLAAEFGLAGPLMCRRPEKKRVFVLISTMAREGSSARAGRVGFFSVRRPSSRPCRRPGEFYRREQALESPWLSRRAHGGGVLEDAAQ